ncbi:TetR/AcrR family transcriptional regulator [Chitinophaga parva]|uniref:TetR/AcrR family transcriptional regulator n=1 Tax=Chitinophaga parva TaxID=2169414 RepID=A0A2T7BM00_9BACT|nr:TetR/AcrR family transcriptional regulator [Chitinophaga parva]PUZ28660.1 TetR/AcrR family transcriptional regulator [Chitinophaga parva]
MSANIKEEEIQEQLLQAAKQLFQVHGFRRVTLDDIAKAIGKARSSLYYYYKTKEEILDAVIGVEIRALMASLAAAISKAPNVEEKIKAFFLAKLSAVIEKGAFFNSLDEGMDPSELSGFRKTRLAVHDQIFQQEGAMLAQVITEGIRLGELTRLNHKDQDDLVFVLLSSLRGMKREMTIKNDFSNMESWVNILVRSMIHGLKQ